ncbi:L-aspartate oxidase [Clostridium pasteurianum DSM 525 = ATCC 6013]|uniref:L-aspartate oxidase n=1 Tax=Clostridium pasteurianum DSM 525 = ATCC 6013 TaxID=1262449 RepID=A0A0H3J343_CLOPA|nr:L-aspartate oxidase [Clostridium pasteurianum]AJA46333.1 L-aspartate oxidase [Clostridium pasteurianum DSM 525 = ATCC 6013]AJA50321.1 L-aspartate oxidase [Clostridium pasteurianum DSM 525 = ATCC 6013]AOZ73775.1 L-aspartate oxidase [Clostridium pasteurianum DSM 525 = ATCC 6013]AOZ77572.1 L-aspartate oxidase [Clostridium pasteurianum]ELP60910.1 L-aspartate oxidase [Clostridium pasteurianum DSM 525 = ATCC 6013]
MDIYTDILIVGCGVAGMYSALNIDKKYKVVIISKSKAEECNTYLAQGGISCARGYEDIDLFVEDTIKAGKNKNRLEAVKILAEESVENIHRLIEFGMKFDYKDGQLDYTREGAHSINRIVHSTDETGKKVFETLFHQVKNRDNITVYEDTILVDILKLNEGCCGGIVKIDNRVDYIHSKYTILASGGIGGLFLNSTNRRTITADGIAIALRNDIEVENLQYVQFHPTALYQDNSQERKFLISESLRGEGAKLFNINKQRFVDELLPRDIVADRIWREEKNTNSKFVYLDASFMNSDFLINRFPGIYRECKNRKIDITKEPIPVTPVQHYFMGGIKVDSNSKTSMNNLYACGEVSCTGVHGANRLASNSLLEGLVFSRRAALDINKNIYDKNIVNIKRDISLEEADNLINLNLECITNEFKKVLGEKRHELINN